MTNKEAAYILDPATTREALAPYAYDPERRVAVVEEACRIAAAAIRPVSKEKVEKMWRGEWERITDPYGKIEGFLCKCGTQTYSASNFCPHCGGAKTDEAVQMVMERMEALHDTGN